MRLIQSGPRNARIILVGEAPGKKEDETGIPFHPQAGAGGVLDKCLNAARIYRSECFITNVVHARPKGNEFTRFLKPSISPHYIFGVLQLKKDIEEIKPNLVVALGAHAMKALSGLDTIDKWRGSVIGSVLVPGQKMLTTYHPARTLYDAGYPYKAVIELDLRRAQKQMQFPEIRRIEREYIINPPASQASELCTEMSCAEWLAIDIETVMQDNGKWKLSCVGFSDRPSRALVLHADDTNRQFIRALCTSRAKKIFQNGYTFDIPVLLAEGIEVKNFAHDTIIGMHSLYPECASAGDETTELAGKKKATQPALRKGLAFQTSIWTDVPYYKDDGKLWKETQDLEMFWRYNAQDAAVTREICDRQREEHKELGVEEVFAADMALVPVTQKMTHTGILVDIGVRDRMKKMYEEEIHRLQDFLDGGAGSHINVKSNKQIAELLFNRIGLPVLRKSEKTNKPSADKDTINRLAEEHAHPLLLTILEIRERRDLIERYLNVLLDDDGRMRCIFDITGTRTGRLASRASIYGTGTNLQNQPPALREMFMADPDMVMFSIDYSQAEARVVAWYARCEALIELFLDSTRDVHKENAARFYNIPVFDVSFEQRYVAKRTIHASNYGMKWFKFWRVVNNDAKDTGIRISKTEAQHGQEMYFMLYPEIKTVFWEMVRTEIWNTRSLTSAFGRRRDFFGKWDDKFLNECYAYLPQSYVGDLTKRAMIEIDKHEPRAVQLVNGHDSIIGQCPREEVESVTTHVAKLMDIRREISGRELPIPVDIEVGLNWGKRKVLKDGSVKNPDGLRSLDEWLST